MHNSWKVAYYQSSVLDCQRYTAASWVFTSHLAGNKLGAARLQTEAAAALDGLTPPVHLIES
jgi:hypothetical protein